MLIDVKKEVCSDNEPDDNDMEILKDEIELKICKTEPNLNCIESLGDSTNIPLACEKKLYTNLTEIKTKLKSLKEIEFKRKPAKKNICKTVKKAIKLEAELESNGKRCIDSIYDLFLI